MANKQVIITVSGGVAEVTSVPEGVDVIIRDYDVDGCDSVDTKEDNWGSYVEGVWPGGD